MTTYYLYIDDEKKPRLQSTNLIYLNGRGQAWRLQNMCKTYTISRKETLEQVHPS